MSSLGLIELEVPEDPLEAKANQSVTGKSICKAMTGLQGNRQNSSSQSDNGPQGGRDVEPHDSAPEAGGEPEVKRRKAAQPHKVKRTLSSRMDLSSPNVQGGRSDREFEGAAASMTETELLKEETAAAGNGSQMIVHGFNHEFELEVDVEDTLRNVIRLIQPSLNFDLSKAIITLRGEHQLTLETRLQYFVKGGSQGMVKVKLVAVFTPNERSRVTIMDVLQAEPIPAPSAIQPALHPMQIPLSSSKQPRKAKKPRLSNGVGYNTDRTAAIDETDWITSESFSLLRSSLGLPLDPVEWDQSHISHWLAWATKAFSLPDLNVVLFSQLSGHSLCSMSRDMFVALVGKDKDDLFWTHFDILRTNKRAAVPMERNISKPLPSPKAPTKRSHRATGDKKPLTMSAGWKNRDSDLFASESAGTIQLWQFLLETLAAGRERDAIEWSGEAGEFRLNNPERVAELWGNRKNKDNMNYEKMSRALRYYYGGDILAKVPGKHYSYKFICDLSAAGYTVAELSSNGNFGHENHAVNLGSVSPVPTYSPSQPSSPSVRGSIGDSDGSIDVPLRPRKSTKSQRVGSLASALESIRRRHDRSASQVAA